MPTAMHIDGIPAFVEYAPEDGEFQGLARAQLGEGTVSVAFRGRSANELRENFRGLWLAAVARPQSAAARGASPRPVGCPTGE
jgi:hypothetical protein